MSAQPTHVYPIRIGSIIAGKYRVERVLGEGGAGVVVAATHVELDQLVAIKLVRMSESGAREAVARCKREAMAAARIKSEHVVHVHDVATLPDGTPYIIMEYLEGIDLGERIEQYGPLPIREAIDYVLQACDALVLVHDAGVVHRDLKPANIHLEKKHDGRVFVRLLDFGLSKMLPRSPLARVVPSITKPREIAGSPGYMPPEQVRGDRDIDERADVWAMGAILYEALTGKRAFDAGSIPEILNKVLDEEPASVLALRQDTPREIAEVVHRCLSKKRDDRYASAADLARAIREAARMHDDRTRVRVITPLEKIAPALPRKRRTLPRAFIAVGVALGIFAVVLHVASEPAEKSNVVLVQETASEPVKAPPPVLEPEAYVHASESKARVPPPPILHTAKPKPKDDIPDYGDRK